MHGLYAQFYDKQGVALSAILKKVRTFGKATANIEHEAMFLPGLGILISDGVPCNGGIIFTDESKLAGGADVGVFCKDLVLQHHFRLKCDCNVFRTKIFAILKAIDAHFRLR